MRRERSRGALPEEEKRREENKRNRQLKEARKGHGKRERNNGMAPTAENNCLK